MFGTNKSLKLNNKSATCEAAATREATLGTMVISNYCASFHLW